MGIFTTSVDSNETNKKFGALYNTVGWWEWDKCLYPTRLDTYGQWCSHNCSYCYARALLDFRWLRHPQNPKFIDLKTAYKIAGIQNDKLPDYDEWLTASNQ